MHYLFCPFNPGPKGNNGGYAMLNPGWIHPSRVLNSSVIIVGRKGSVRLKEEEDLIEVKPNRLVLLTAGKKHKGVEPIDTPAAYYWLHFTIPTNSYTLFSNEDIVSILSNPIITQQRLSKASLIPQQLDLVDSDLITLLFRELLNEQERPCYTNLRFQLMFQNLLIAITEATIKSYQPPQDISVGSNLVYEVISDLNSQLTNPDLSVKSIANNLDYNSDYINRKFKMVMGIPINSYILQQRIRLAEQLLQETHDTVAEIAKRCGFSSTRNFLRQFRKERGITPTELRHRQKALHVNIY